MRTYKCYLGGPIDGIPIEEVRERRAYSSKFLSDTLTVLDPTKRPPIDFNDREQATRVVWADLFEVQSADYILVDLGLIANYPSVKAWGSMAELGFAAAIGKRPWVVVPDINRVHPFITTLAQYITDDLDIALASIRRTAQHEQRFQSDTV